MGSYTAISDVGNRLVDFFRKSMTPEPVASPEMIKLCSPSERTNEVLCIYLYDIKTSEGINDKRMIPIDKTHQRFPPIFIELYYMLTPYSNGDARARSIEEQRILGKILQAANDQPILAGNQEIGEAGSVAGEIMLTPLSLSMEEQNQIWNFVKGNGKLSLFYKVSPVEIQSVRIREIKPVREKVITVEEM